MRFHVDGGKAYFIGCLVLTWTLTACVGDMMPTQASQTEGKTYEVIKGSPALEKGMMRTQILDGNGHEVFQSVYNSFDYANAASIAMPAFTSTVDSLNMRAIGAFLTGKGTGSPSNGTVEFSLKGQNFSIEMIQRASTGEGRSFKIKLRGDTTLVVTTPDGSIADKQFQLTTGGQVLYSGTSSVGQAENGASAEADPGGGEDEDATCGERFAIIAGELSSGIYGVVQGIIDLDPIEVIAGMTLFFNSWAQMYLWVIEDCPNTFANWLSDFWISNCLDPLFSWTPFCE